MVRFLLTALLASAATPLAATPPEPGHWAVLTAGGAIMRIDLVRTQDGWAASLLRPVHFTFGEGEFSAIGAQTVSLPASLVREVDGDLELTIPDPAPGEDPSVFRFHQMDPTHATLALVGPPLEPFSLLLTPTAAPIAPFDPQRSYAVVADRPDNPDMARIFAADQADRADPEHIDWGKVGGADEARRTETQQLLDAGRLQSGEDFYRAAFVFQHGSQPDDYLKAHLLAIAAMARGKPSAKWIAAATLDRYLASIGRKQVLGTQFRVVDGRPVIEPDALDQSLVPDSVRDALGVPPVGAPDGQPRRIAQPTSGD